MKIYLTKKEVLEKFNLLEGAELVIEGLEDETVDSGEFYEVDFPEMTAKEIYEQSDNKLGNGKLLYDIDRYKNEDFFLKEKTRPGKRLVLKNVIGVGKDWNECQALVKEKGGEMLNFAEVLYVIWKYPGFLENMYTWTSSRSSVGFLVNVGEADAGGASVDGWEPDLSDSDLGVVFLRSLDNLQFKF